MSGAGVNVRFVQQDDSEINITVGIDEADLRAAVQAVHQACF